MLVKPLACLFFSASLALAQVPEATPIGLRSRDLAIPPPNPSERIAERLKLDAAKTQQLQKIYQQLGVDMAKLRIQMERKQLDLKELLLSGNLELDKLRKNCDERGKVMADMQFLAFIADSDVKKLLTPDQWTQYIQLKSAMMDHGIPRAGREGGDSKGRK